MCSGTDIMPLRLFPADLYLKGVIVRVRGGHKFFLAATLEKGRGEAAFKEVSQEATAGLKKRLENTSHLFEAKGEPFAVIEEASGFPGDIRTRIIELNRLAGLPGFAQKGARRTTWRSS